MGKRLSRKTLGKNAVGGVEEVMIGWGRGKWECPKHAGIRMLLYHCCLSSLSHTLACKSPLLLFMGSFDGSMHKWERLQLNPFDFQ